MTTLTLHITSMTISITNLPMTNITYYTKDAVTTEAMAALQHNVLYQWQHHYCAKKQPYFCTNGSITNIPLTA